MREPERSRTIFWNLLNYNYLLKVWGYMGRQVFRLFLGQRWWRSDWTSPKLKKKNEEINVRPQIQAWFFLSDTFWLWDLGCGKISRWAEDRKNRAHFINPRVMRSRLYPATKRTLASFWNSRRTVPYKEMWTKVWAYLVFLCIHALQKGL